MTGRKTQPAGWYPDPGGQPLLRWWDGSRWGEQTQAAPPSGGRPHPAAPQAQPGYGIVPPPPDPGVAGRRTALGMVLVTLALIAGLAVASRAGPSPQPASQLVVQGRVTGTDGVPVSGIKVWLNAWPNAAVVQRLTNRHQPVGVTVLGSVTTSAAGGYAMRVLPSAALAAGATNGVVKFMVMAGDSAGWDAFSFSRRLAQTAARTPLAVPSGGTVTADLHLMPH